MVLSTQERATARAGYFPDVIAIKEFSPLEPKLVEFKLFARGVGLVRAFQVSGGSGREELVRYSK